MKDELQFKCLSVGISGPKFKQEPIQGSHLFVMPSGKFYISILKSAFSNAHLATFAELVYLFCRNNRDDRFFLFAIQTVSKTQKAAPETLFSAKKVNA